MVQISTRHSFNKETARSSGHPHGWSADPRRDRSRKINNIIYIYIIIYEAPRHQGAQGGKREGSRRRDHDRSRPPGAGSYRRTTGIGRQSRRRPRSGREAERAAQRASPGPPPRARAPLVCGPAGWPKDRGPRPPLGARSLPGKGGGACQGRLPGSMRAACGVRRGAVRG